MDYCPIVFTFRNENVSNEETKYKSFVNYTTLKMEIKIEKTFIEKTAWMKKQVTFVRKYATVGKCIYSLLTKQKC